MFRRLRSFRSKVTALATLTTAIALLLSISLILVFDFLEAKAAALRSATIVADIAAEGSAAALVFEDAQAAEKTLSDLAADPQILHASIWHADHRVLASFAGGRGRDIDHDAVPGLGHRFESDILTLTRPIVHDNEMLGVIHIHYDLRPLQASVADEALLLLGVMIIAVIIAWVTARHLQEHITGPVQQLAEVAKSVSQRQDYSIRAVKFSEDELGDLTVAFNEMLGQISSRDAALGLARAELEQRVKERTAELERAYDSLQTEMQERERAQAETREAQALLLASIEQSPAGILIAHAPDGRIRVANSAALALGGDGSPSLIDQTFTEQARWRCFHADGKSYDHAQLPLARAIRGGETVNNAEILVAREDGTRRWIVANAAPVRNDDDEVTAGVVVFLDVTEERQAQREREEMHSKLVETSRLAGMAEVATGVLHNVGNVLNSVNVSSSLITEKVRKSAATDVVAVADLLQQHRESLASFITEDERGRLIPDFLTELGRTLLGDNTKLLTELEALNASVSHIKDIVATQQSYAKVSGAAERLDLRDVLEDAIRINDAGFRRHEVRVEREFEDVPQVIADRHKVLQIVVNLLGNAKYALCERPAGDRLLRLELRRKEDAEDRLIIRVTDNGVGIPAENMRKIFTHGFTTRRHGHGFGLHSGALAATVLGGSLTAASDGPGRGATFTLELPLKPGGSEQ